MIFFSPSIRAQIGNLYDSSSDDVAGINALMSAVANNDVNGVKFFSKAGRALINQKNFGGATALHVAAREGNTEIAKTLIENGADVNVVDNEGWTPLMRASLAGNKDIVALLLQRDAQGSNLNSLGESAIIHATTSNCADCLNEMFEKYNFVRQMDLKLLKEQLTDAFVIARNRENEAIQGLITAYLDQVIKMSPLIEKEKTDIAVENAQPTEKVFKITSADFETAKPLVASAPIEATTQDKKVFVRKIVTAPAPLPVSTPILVKPQQPIYKFNGQCNCDPKAAPVAVVGLNNAKEKEVILLSKKPDSTPVSKVVSTESGNVIFKFNRGPEGKSKPKIKIAKPVAALPDVINTKIASPVPVKVDSVKPSPANPMQSVKLDPISKTKLPTKTSALPIAQQPKPAPVHAPSPVKIPEPVKPAAMKPIVAEPTKAQPIIPTTQKVAPKFVIGILPKEPADAAPTEIIEIMNTKKPLEKSKPVPPKKKPELIDKSIIIDPAKPTAE